jgi:hypothetical protein
MKDETVMVNFMTLGRAFGVMKIDAVHVYLPNDKIDVFAASLKAHLDRIGAPA